MKKLVVNRKDLKNNLKIIRKLLNSEGKDDNGKCPQIIAVVKGNGMGLGLIEYSKFLVNNGINILAVANYEEAIKLRNAGIKEEILMLTPIVKEKELINLIENNVTLTISNIENLELIEKIIKDEEKSVNVHLKIDTGFARYGTLYFNKEAILDIFKNCQKVKIVGTYTHFAKPIDEKFTNEQFNRFLDVIGYIKQNGQDPGLLHCSESTAFLKYKMMNLNAVRIGSILQGRTLIKGNELKIVGKFISNVQEIKSVPKGYNISYGNMFKTRKNTKIAIIPVGYMDGFNMRKDRDIYSFKENCLSVGIEIKKFFKDNTLKIKIKDKYYKVIGRIGMYHCVVDITENDDIKVGDEVELNISPLQVNSDIRREYV